MRALRGVLVLVIFLASACVATPGPTGITALLSGGLRPFSDCDEGLDFLREHGRERVTPWGLPGAWGGVMPLPGVFDAVAMEADGAGGDASGSQRAVSGTNVQVAGVDEPDLAKTDGDRLLALAKGRLYVVDLSGDVPELRGSLELSRFHARDLFLLGDRALLLGEATEWEGPRGFHDDVAIGFAPQPISALVEVDLSDPAEPRIASRLLLDGGYVSARMVDGVARVVVSAFPTGLVFEPPEGGGLRAEREALRRNRQIIEESRIEQWMPAFVLEDGDGATLAEGTLLGCGSAYRPPEFSGFGTLAVLTLDLSQGLPEDVAGRSVGVISDGQHVYASADSLYVATQRWVDWGAGELAEVDEGTVTRIHRFDISGDGAAAYRSSGNVDGWLLNQFSMDEHEGHLRVASTDSPALREGAGSSESMVTVLAERDGRLAEVGRVSGLGKGEQIFAVRFLGDRGYVVTFRQIDPLYVVDLSDPTSPTVEGELKILGYSAYLHPLSERLLVGVGQDATRQGRLRGTQLSLFDVSDPAAPRRIDSVGISGGSSEVEWDHHAFLYWEPEGLAVVPVNAYRWQGGVAEDFSGAIAVRITDGGLQEAGRLEHERDRKPGWGEGIRRSLVVGDLLLTVSDAGLEASDLGTFDDVAWVPFG